MPSQHDVVQLVFATVSHHHAGTRRGGAAGLVR
jgi:hypothetical protein